MAQPKRDFRTMRLIRLQPRRQQSPCCHQVNQFQFRQTKDLRAQEAAHQAQHASRVAAAAVWLTAHDARVASQDLVNVPAVARIVRVAAPVPDVRVVAPAHVADPDVHVVDLADDHALAADRDVLAVARGVRVAARDARVVALVQDALAVDLGVHAAVLVHVLEADPDVLVVALDPDVLAVVRALDVRGADRAHVLAVARDVRVVDPDVLAVARDVPAAARDPDARAVAREHVHAADPDALAVDRGVHAVVHVALAAARMPPSDHDPVADLDALAADPAVLAVAPDVLAADPDIHAVDPDALVQIVPPRITVLAMPKRMDHVAADHVPRV